MTKRSAVNPTFPMTVRVLACIFAAIVIAGAPASAVASGTAKVRGKVVDEEGNPVGGISVRFVPADEEGNPDRTLKVSKKGQFSHSFFPAGKYAVELADSPERFIESMSYVMRDPSGIEVDRGTVQARSGQGLDPVRIGLGMNVRLELVLGTQVEREQLMQKVALAEAAGPLKKINELYQAGDMKQVETEAEALLATKPDLGLAHYLLGLAQSQLGQSAAAVESLRKAEDLSPEQQGVAGALGTALLQEAREKVSSGDEAGAIAAYREASDALEKEMERFGPSIPYLANRAAALEGAGDNERFVPALKALVEADPQNINAFLKLITVQTQLGDLDGAMQSVDLAPKTQPVELAMTTYNLAAANFNAGNIDQAIAAADKALALDPGLGSAYHLLGLAYLSKDDRESAIANFEKVLEVAPDDPIANSTREILQQLKP